MKRKIVFLLFAVMLSLVLCIPSMAANRAGAWSVTPFIGGYNFDSDEDLDDTLLYGLRVGYNFTKNWTVEAVGTFANDVDWDGSTYSRLNGWQKLDNETDMYGYKLEVLYNFLPDGMIVPFVAAGAGGRYLEWDKGGSDHDFIVDYGAGLKVFFRGLDRPPGRHPPCLPAPGRAEQRRIRCRPVVLFRRHERGHSRARSRPGC